MLYFHQMTLEVKGKHGWKARYVKEVDVMEKTVKFYQEIYDENSNLKARHITVMPYSRP